MVCSRLDHFQRQQKAGNERQVEKAQSSTPYQNDYREFEPWPDTASLPLYSEEINVPFRSSLLDGIAYFWTKTASESQISSAMKCPFTSTLFLRRIIASIWINTLEYQFSTLRDLEFKCV